MRRRARLVRLVGLAVSGALWCGTALAQDSPDFVVRLNRLEGQVRTLSGQVEQLQFDNRQLKDTLRKFQEDTEFRFQERSGGGARTGTAPATQPSGSTSTPGQGRPGRRSDAFDPSGDATAPGSPRALGGNQAVSRDGGASREARSPDGIASIIDDEGPRASAAPLDLGAAARSGNPAALPRSETGMPPSVAATGSGDPRTDYDTAYAYVLNRQYDQAEMGFRRFIQSHPRDKLLPDATYWLGETYLQRNRAREAAEQFLKISTDYSRSSKAPDALLKLGMSLSSLGAKDQACATFAEVERKFPTAGPGVKQGVEREQKRARCPA